MDHTKICPRCEGNGHKGHEELCIPCGGRGYVPTSEFGRILAADVFEADAWIEKGILPERMKP